MTVATTPVLARRRLTLPTVAASVPAARRAARVLLADWLAEEERDLADAALLVLSELVTNTVRHAAPRSPFSDVALTLTREALVIAVHDRHPVIPAPRSVAHADGCGGRGLAIVAALADEAGGELRVVADADALGKTSTVRLPRP
ncbi:ATP-binding protein [Streptomyces sp. NPDC057702]|uniref:ATP-binding protein n=1 Tax=unclassified Streptomyces TaxID=2593676 RepID=UPI0036A50832